MKVLAIIDAQNDFIDGTMGVGLEKWNPAKAEILKLVESEHYDGYIYTQDWHPADHCSFNEHGGPWPAHCVGNTDGAKIDMDLTRLPAGAFDTLIRRKGRDQKAEEYGVDLLGIPKNIDEGVEEIHIVGLCYDYCVAACAKMTSENHPEVKVIVKKAGTVAINEDATPDFGDAIVE